MYEEELKELGLTENEAKIYLAILKLGLTNPSQISEKIGLHRPYVYDALNRLIEKGVVSTILKDGKKHYQVESPDALKEIFNLKLQRLNQIIPSLNKLYHETKWRIKVEIHKGKVLRTAIKKIISKAKINDEVLIIGMDEEKIMSIEPIYLKQYFNIIKNKRIKERIIIKKKGERLKEKNLIYKELDPEFIGNIVQAIHQDIIYLILLGEPDQMITIENENIAKTYKKQFELFWKISKP